MAMRSALLLIPLLPLALAACGETPVRTVSTAPAPARAAPPPALGLERVMGQEASTLTTLFGAPALDLREGPARKLQFRGPACTLDAYLYPPQSATGPARVTWLDARTPQGGDFDRASCIAALVRR
ncbi:hypothetical protein [Sphingomonas nostoxanthinifaciens]|uniref:hypothetical protein n=1 Tax=Sphingomonas nostoxanthinifaciens TaxID=2872652 RepID=UPI001CC1E60F|nr:hypothetical protein [Sphingomonas nostoxanthinifaciens]UAK24080.1 hypothetical protein K8P63_17330 [Sphingomonas nostoxanthinifaciens]